MNYHTGKKRIKNPVKYLQAAMRHRYAMHALLAILILALFFRPLIYSVILLAAASASKKLQDFFPFVIGFDIVLFVTVIISYSYGAVLGVPVAVLSSLFGSWLRKNEALDSPFFPPISYALIALLTPYLVSWPILTVGLAATAFHIIFMNIVFVNFSPDILKTITFSSSSIAFNWWLFSNHASSLMALMA